MPIYSHGIVFGMYGDGPRRRRGSVPADIELCRACRRALDEIFAA
ncbi:hypothetical protein [Nocardia amikacinitolerans]|nr:hypothetical protein [Nocardia amikacinitolerans]